jgi:Mg2+/Co2+ transporter CorB
MKDNDRILVTVLILNNLSNIVIASYATAIALGIAETLGFDNQTLVISVSTFIITVLILIF